MIRQIHLHTKKIETFYIKDYCITGENILVLRVIQVSEPSNALFSGHNLFNVSYFYYHSPSNSSNKVPTGYYKTLAPWQFIRNGGGSTAASGKGYRTLEYNMTVEQKHHNKNNPSAATREENV